MRLDAVKEIQSLVISHDAQTTCALLRHHDHDHRDRDPRGAYHDGSYPHSRSSQRGPTPPGIATLPGASAHDDEGYDDRERERDRAPRARLTKPVNGHAHGSGASGSSRSASRTPPMNAAKHTHSGRGSPRGSDGKSKSSELMDVDADGEEVDADADAGRSRGGGGVTDVRDGSPPPLPLCSAAVFAVDSGGV